MSKRPKRKTLDRWHDAKGRKPGGARDVLLHVRFGACDGTFCVVGWWWRPDGWIIPRWNIEAERVEVLHWRDLPPPPKVRKKRSKK